MSERVDVRNFEFFAANGTNYMLASLLGAGGFFGRDPFAGCMSGFDVFHFKFFAATHAKFMFTTFLGASRR